MRIGAKKRPFYRVVAVDERAKRTGGYIELLGTYNPLTEPKDIKLKQDRIDHWVKQGAQMSVGFLRIIGKAPQRAPRKPKKEKREESPAVNPQTTEETEKTVQKDSEKPENQQVSGSENQKEQVSESTDTPTPSDSSETPSPSESSENEESNK